MGDGAPVGDDRGASFRSPVDGREEGWRMVVLSGGAGFEMERYVRFGD